MPPWQSKRRCVDVAPEVIKGEWEDIDMGYCSRCNDYRNVYRPVLRPSLIVCAPCSQIYACVSTPSYGEAEEDFESFGEEEAA